MAVKMFYGRCMLNQLTDAVYIRETLDHKLEPHVKPIISMHLNFLVPDWWGKKGTLHECLISSPYLGQTFKAIENILPSHKSRKALQSIKKKIYASQQD